MTFWLFNTDESEAPGKGAFERMLAKPCIATWGRISGNHLIASPVSGDQVFYYRDGVGVIAKAEFNDSAPYRSNDIFQKQDEDEFSRPVINLVRPVDAPISNAEVKAGTGSPLPVKGRTPHRMNSQAVIKFLLKRFPGGAKSAGEVFPFKPGGTYTRQDIQKVLRLPEQMGGDFYTGYSQVRDDFFVFCGVGVPGRTGHQYENHFDGDELIWRGKTKSRLEQPQIQSLLTAGRRVYIFFREDNRAPFTFAGLGTPVQVKDETPVVVRWGFTNPQMPGVSVLPEEVTDPGTIIEGAKKTITVNVYERDPRARARCLAKWGTACVVCDFDFGQTFGELGEGYIHVHHLKPLGEIQAAYELDPVEDLRPVCPNCHAMLHRRSPALSVAELRDHLD